MSRLKLLLLVLLCVPFALAVTPPKFAAPVAYPTGASSPNGLALGDLNGDGHLDVVVANEDDPGTIAVLLGNGNGTLQAPVKYAAGAWPGFVVIADFNKDGHMDVAVANRAIGTPGQVLIFLGNGDGTLQSPVTYGPFQDAFSMAVGDFNGDGKLDIVVADTASGSLLLGKGDGTFEIGNPIGATNVTWFAVADFNRDHKLDLAATDNGGSALQILLGNGKGGFTVSSTRKVATPPISVAAKDLNGDGIPDLAIADEAVNNQHSNVTVLLSSATGRVGKEYPYGHEPRCIVFAVFNRRNDIVTANEFSGTVDVFVNQGNGVYQAPLVLPIGALTAVDVAVGDLNGDGKQDIVVTDGLIQNGSVRVLLQE
ncbi:FG-GAP repeat domain-containing protein [Bradyrhizobium sp.]